MSEDPASAPPAAVPAAVRIALPVRPPRVTYVLIGFTVFIYLMQLLSTAIFGEAAPQVDWLEVFGARLNSAMRAGQWWRFITPVFLHASPLHIFFNMYALLSVGTFLERHYGHSRFALLYFLGGFAGNVLSFFFGDNSGFSIGASTAVFGLIAAEVVFFYQNRQLFGRFARQAIGNAVVIIFVNLFIGLAPGIDNWGHVGGLFGGAIFAWFAGPRWLVDRTLQPPQLIDERGNRELVLGSGLVLLIFGALIVLRM